eukprot:scaffold7292_cov132-Isochrysis_galbana.AAC.1
MDEGFSADAAETPDAAAKAAATSADSAHGPRADAVGAAQSGCHSHVAGENHEQEHGDKPCAQGHSEQGLAGHDGQAAASHGNTSVERRMHPPTHPSEDGGQLGELLDASTCCSPSATTAACAAMSDYPLLGVPLQVNPGETTLAQHSAGPSQPLTGQALSVNDAPDEPMLGGGSLHRAQQVHAVYAENCPEGAFSIEEGAHFVADKVYVDVWTVDCLTHKELTKYALKDLSDPPRSLPCKAVKFTMKIEGMEYAGILTSDGQFVLMTKVCYLRRRDDRLGPTADRVAPPRVGCPVYYLQKKRGEDYLVAHHGYVVEPKDDKVQVKWAIQRFDEFERTSIPDSRKMRYSWADCPVHYAMTERVPDTSDDDHKRMLNYGIDSLPGRDSNYWEHMRMWQDPIKIDSIANNYWLVSSSFVDDVQGHGVLEIPQHPILDAPAASAAAAGQ